MGVFFRLNELTIITLFHLDEMNIHLSHTKSLVHSTWGTKQRMFTNVQMQDQLREEKFKSQYKYGQLFKLN